MCFSLSYDIDSIEFYFRGYADKLEGFIYDCLNMLKQFKASEHSHTFKVKKEMWLKDLKNFFYDEPNDQLRSLIIRMMVSGNFTTKHMISVGEKLTFERFIELSDKILQNGRHLWF